MELNGGNEYTGLVSVYRLVAEQRIKRVRMHGHRPRVVDIALPSGHDTSLCDVFSGVDRPIEAQSFALTPLIPTPTLVSM